MWLLGLWWPERPFKLCRLLCGNWSGPPNELFFRHPLRDLVLTIQSSTTSQQTLSTSKHLVNQPTITRFDSGQVFDKISQDGKPISMSMMPGPFCMQSIKGKRCADDTKSLHETKRTHTRWEHDGRSDHDQRKCRRRISRRIRKWIS